MNLSFLFKSTEFFFGVDDSTIIPLSAVIWSICPCSLFAQLDCLVSRLTKTIITVLISDGCSFHYAHQKYENV